MVYTLTLNPALDYVLRLPSLSMGHTNRARQEQIFPGGKGINVAYVLRELGVEAVALGFVAGFTGDALVSRLKADGINTRFISLPEGSTRINVKLKEDGRETEINASGPSVPPEALQSLMDKLALLGEGDTLVLAGSIPPSLPRDLYAVMAEAARGRGVRVVVDAEGETLSAVLPHAPFLIKPNRAELEGVAGRPLPTEQDLLSAARDLQGRGAQNVLVSLGGEGALLLDAHGNVHRASAHAITPVNTVGAGDSMLAGFIAGLEDGYASALALAQAAGAATAASEGLATRREIENFYGPIPEKLR